MSLRRKEKTMTYGMLKKRICSLLDVDMDAVGADGSLLSVLNAQISPAVGAAVRKVAVYLMAIIKKTELVFERNGSEILALLPSDFISGIRIRRGGRTYGRDSFELLGGRIRLLSGTEGTYELTYCAYPMFTDMESDADTDIGFDDFAADTAAYGAAAELCHSIYPGDMKRYMRLATEFDERLVNAAPRSGDNRIADSVFRKRRSIL